MSFSKIKTNDFCKRYQKIQESRIRGNIKNTTEKKYKKYKIQQNFAAQKKKQQKEKRNIKIDYHWFNKQ